MQCSKILYVQHPVLIWSFKIWPYGILYLEILNLLLKYTVEIMKMDLLYLKFIYFF